MDKEENMREGMRRSVMIARTGIFVLIGGFILSFSCYGLFMKDPEKPVWVLVGAAILLLCLGVEILCFRAARRISRREYGRIGLAHKNKRKIPSSEILGSNQ